MGSDDVTSRERPTLRRMQDLSDLRVLLAAELELAMTRAEERSVNLDQAAKELLTRYLALAYDAGRRAESDAERRRREEAK